MMVLVAGSVLVAVGNYLPLEQGLKPACTAGIRMRRE